MRSSIFWHIMLCSTVKGNRCFGGTCSLQLASRWFLAWLILSPWRWSDKILWNIGWLPVDYLVLNHRRQNSFRHIHNFKIISAMKRTAIYSSVSIMTLACNYGCQQERQIKHSKVNCSVICALGMLCDCTVSKFDIQYCDLSHTPLFRCIYLLRSQLRNHFKIDPRGYQVKITVHLCFKPIFWITIKQTLTEVQFQLEVFSVLNF
jgi:hypothetical protein